jgi:hypothetical protein
MNVNDELVRGTITINNLEQSRSALGWHLLSRSPIVSRKKNHLSLCTCSPNSSHSGLNTVSPLVDIWDIMWLWSIKVNKT